MIVTIDDLRRRALTYAVILLWAHVPLLALMGQILEKDGVACAILLAAIAALVTLQVRVSGATLSAQISAAAGLAIAVCAIVYLLRGHPWQADSHMIFFAAFALTAVFCDWRPIATYAIVIALHHLVLNFALTEAIFPGEASVGRVALHAVVLVVEAIPLIWLSTVLVRLFASSDSLLNEAKVAQTEATTYAEAQKTERVALGEVVTSLGGGLKDLAACNLTRPLGKQFAESYEPLRHDFNSALETLSGTIDQVIDASQNIHARSQVISGAAEDLSRRTENQAAALEEAAAALDELTNSVKLSAAGAQDVETIVQEAQRKAQGSKQIVQDAVSAMSEIERSSLQISQIIGSIDDIAFQTNLLALNAGIEAARAGEAGRGFAVVASEVRALAQRSLEAAKEIKTLIGDSARHVSRGVDEVGKAGETLNTMLGSVVEISALVTNIAAAAGQQSLGLNEINMGVTQLDQVTQKNAAMVEETTAASLSLREDSTGLAQVVSRFKVPPKRGPAPSTESLWLEMDGPMASEDSAAPEAPPARAMAAGRNPKWQAF